MPKSATIDESAVNTAAPKKEQRKAARQAAKNAPPPPTKGKGKKPAAESNGQSPPVENKPKPTIVPEEEESREIIYDKVKVNIYQGEKALTAAQAKTLIGWQEETAEKKLGDSYTLVNHAGKKVRLTKNRHNRPFDASLAKLWEAEHLNGNWALNGENLIIGETGETISAQHRLCGLILAVEEWTRNPGKYPHWTSEPTMECTICFGVKEDARTVNTIGTGKPQGLDDVLYRIGAEYFSGMKRSQLAKVTGILAHALKMVCHRTGAFLDAFSSKRTHADHLDFLYRHLKLVDCVKHVYEEDGEGKDGGRIKHFISPGYAAGLMYLMSCSSSDPEAYRQADPPVEDLLDFSNAEKAEEFWSLLAGGEHSYAPVRKALDALMEEELNEDEEVVRPAGATRNERLALLCKAWACVANDQPITAKRLDLTYAEDDDGIKTLAECPTVGGIDLGDPHPDDEPNGKELESIEARKAALKAEKDAKANGKAAKPAAKGKKPPTKKSDLKVGDAVYVSDPDAGQDGVWRGTLEEIYPTDGGPVARITVDQGFPGAGQVNEAPLALCSPNQPVFAGPDATTGDDEDEDDSSAA